MATASEVVAQLRGLGVVGGVDVVDEVLRTRPGRMTGNEAAKKKGLCEAMIQTEDRLEMQRGGRVEARVALQAIRRALECEVWA